MSKIGQRVTITNPRATYDLFKQMAKNLHAKNWQKYYLPHREVGMVINKFKWYYLIQLNNGIEVIMDKSGFKTESILPDELFEI